MDRDQHLAQAKERALEAIGRNPRGVLTSFYHELMEHPDLADHPGIEIGVVLLATGNLTDPDKVRAHIEGFA